MSRQRPTTVAGRKAKPHACVGGCGRTQTFIQHQTHWLCPECQPSAHRRAQERYKAKTFLNAQDRNLYMNHRLRLSDYQRMLEGQGGVCAGCGLAPGDEMLHIDHDHERGCSRPHKRGSSCRDCRRGLLCGDCNRALGLAHEDPATLRGLAAYAERYGQ